MTAKKTYNGGNSGLMFWGTMGAFHFLFFIVYVILISTHKPLASVKVDSISEARNLIFEHVFDTEGKKKELIERCNDLFSISESEDFKGTLPVSSQDALDCIVKMVLAYDLSMQDLELFYDEDGVEGHVSTKKVEYFKMIVTTKAFSSYISITNDALSQSHESLAEKLKNNASTLRNLLIPLRTIELLVEHKNNLDELFKFCFELNKTTVIKSFLSRKLLFDYLFKKPIRIGELPKNETE